MKKKVSVYYLTSEVLPIVKTGGLADVSAALPAALTEFFKDEIDIRIGTVGFRGVENLPGYFLRKTFITRSPAGAITVRIYEGRLENANVPVYAIDPEGLFDRPALYGEEGQEYPDNLERFSIWNHAALHALSVVDFDPDILHANDWQSSLSIPLWPHIRRPSMYKKSIRTIQSIHNLAFQGVYPLDQWHWTGLPPSYNHFDGLEFHGRLSLLKGGIQFADYITTVSPTYREEVLSEPEAHGLSGALRHRKGRFVGLLNGIDDKEWDPETDRFIAVPFSPSSLSGKDTQKLRLREEVGLKGTDIRPLFGVVSRMAHQKGLGILGEALYAMGMANSLKEDWIVLGSGDPQLEAIWRRIHARFPENISLHLGYDEGLAHKILASSDFFLIPSVYEPCGLTQMYAMRYGTLPVVNPTGGLKDTVISGVTGLWFEELSIDGVIEGIKKARSLYYEKKRFELMRLEAMKVDSSWRHRAVGYERLYRSLVDLPAWHNPID